MTNVKKGMAGTESGVACDQYRSFGQLGAEAGREPGTKCGALSEVRLNRVAFGQIRTKAGGEK